MPRYGYMHQPGEPPLSPEDPDERSEEEVRKDEERRADKEISDWEDRQSDPYRY